MTSWEFPRLVFLALEWLWMILGALCLAAAAWMAWRKDGLVRAEAALEKPGARRAISLLLGLALPLLIVLYKLAQAAAFELGYDTGVMANVVWRLAHGWGWTSAVLSGVNFAAFHFSFTYALLAPLQWVFPGAMAPMVVQALVLGSTALGVYWLARLDSRNSLFALIMALIAWSQPLFRELIGSFLDASLIASSLFIWTAYFWESGRRKTAALFAVLLLLTQEQAPFLFFGLALMALVSAKPKDRRIPALACAAALLVFFGELAFIHRMRQGTAYFPNHWLGLYGALGDSPRAVITTTVTRPWLAAAALIWPPVKLWAPVRTMLSFGLLPLFAWPQVLPALVVWLPQQLATVSMFQNLQDHYASFVTGPLLWAAVHGLHRVPRGAAREKRVLAAWLLAVCAGCFFVSARFLNPPEPILESWPEVVPLAMAAVPPNAKLWCDELLVPYAAARPFVKALPWYDDISYFQDGLFMPDRVILSVRWTKMAKAENVHRVMGYLARHGYIKIFNGAGIAVLQHPTNKADGTEPVVWASLDAPEKLARH